jgi:hypothetical protein
MFRGAQKMRKAGVNVARVTAGRLVKLANQIVRPGGVDRSSNVTRTATTVRAALALQNLAT